MPIMTIYLTDNQIARLKYSIIKEKLISKDIRKKIYFIAKNTLRLGDSLDDITKRIIESHTGICVENIYKYFPDNELSINSFVKFMGEKIPMMYWNVNDKKSLRDKMLFFQYLIDEL